ncbi:unnamed protein product [Closterium sp. NIES-65]|nr:unnamed protein product [Closterium sp. NIES-65]CAI6012489.1 unnamed protein product [Closterium sp. NIES-65]
MPASNPAHSLPVNVAAQLKLSSDDPVPRQPYKRADLLLPSLFDGVRKVEPHPSPHPTATAAPPRSVVLCGDVLCGDVLCCDVLCGVVQYGVVVCGAVLCGNVLCGVVLCGVVLCGVVLCCAVLCCAMMRWRRNGGGWVEVPVLGWDSIDAKTVVVGWRFKRWDASVKTWCPPRLSYGDTAVFQWNDWRRKHNVVAIGSVG